MPFFGTVPPCWGPGSPWGLLESSPPPEETLQNPPPGTGALTSGWVPPSGRKQSTHHLMFPKCPLSPLIPKPNREATCQKNSTLSRANISLKHEDTKMITSQGPERQDGRTQRGALKALARPGFPDCGLPSLRPHHALFIWCQLTGCDLAR